jgi:hypothetical protein
MERAMIEQIHGKTLADRLMSALDRNIGRCSKCMRKAFIAASAAWFVLSCAWVAGGLLDSLLFAGALTFAIILTALWLLHLATFAARFAISLPASRMPDEENLTGTKAPAAKAFSKRIFLAKMAKAFISIAMATILPSGFSLAYGRCKDPNAWLCNTSFCNNENGPVCCNEKWRYLNHCDCKCYDSSSFSCGSYTYCSGP